MCLLFLYHNNEVRRDDLSLFHSQDEPVSHSCVMIILAITNFAVGFQKNVIDHSAEILRLFFEVIN